jgi:CYTH domain-containing protein
MAKEIERKFLVREEILTPLLAEGGFEKKLLSQFYLVASKEAAVRLRREHTHAGIRVLLTVKAGGDGMTTNEFEFGIEHGLRQYFDNLASRQGFEIDKTRHLVPHGGRTFEVDVFHGDLEGLVLAELEADDAETVDDLPEWIADEVTFDAGYKNAVLALKGNPSGVADRVASDPLTFAALKAIHNPCLAILPDERIDTSSSARRTLDALNLEPAELAREKKRRSKALDELARLDADFLDLPASDGNDGGTKLARRISNNESVRRTLEALRYDPAEDEILVGEIDEDSSRLMRDAALHGHRSWPDQSQEERAVQVRGVLDTLRAFDFEDPSTAANETDSQKGN